MAIIRALLDKHPHFGKAAFISESATIIGDFICGDHCSFWFNCVIRADVNHIRLGNYVNIQDNAVIHCTYQKYPTIIGDNVSIGHNAIVHGCIIHNNVLVGMGAIVMDNCVIESHSIIAAGAVVPPNTHIAEGEIWAGVPARFLKKVSEETRENEINRIAASYPKYAQWYTDN